MRRSTLGLLVLIGTFSAVTLTSSPVGAVDVLYDAELRLNGEFVTYPNSGPATWMGAAQATGAVPQNVKLPKNQANFFVSSVNPSPATQLGILQSTQVISVTGPDVPATIGPNMGPGNGTFVPPTGLTRPRRNKAFRTAGGAKYGGSVRMIFNFQTQLGFSDGQGGMLVGKIPSHPVLGTTTGAGPGAQGQGTQTFTSTFHTTMTSPPAFTTPVRLQQNVAKWTTGKVIVTDTNPPISTVTITGYDNRTAMGENGNLLLVHANLASTYDFLQTDSVSVFTLKYHFLPEPRNTALLCSGLGGLFLMGFLHRRSRLV